MISNNLLKFLFILLIITSCSKGNNIQNTQENMNNLKSVSQKKWDQLSQHKIYFGHQSVGYNMMDGIEMILNGNPNINLNIKKGKDLNLFKIPVFAHDKNGSNRDPKAKIDDFCDTMENGLGDKVDIAGFKFCYVDIEDGSDVKGLFNHYKKRMDEISLKYPKIKIVHFTCPIKSLQSGPKGFIKKLMGKDIGVNNNIARQHFNELLLNEYKGQIIFDIAKIESTYPDGKREYTEVNEEKVFTMIQAYTNDGGHLSEKGKYIVGSGFLIFLVNLPNGR